MTVVRRTRIGALVALGLGMGCAAVQANRHEPGSIAGNAFSPARPAAAQFGQNQEYRCPVGGAFPVLVSDAAELAKDGHHPVPQPDGRLCAIADTLLGWKEQGTPPESVTSFLAWHFGVPVAPARVVIANVESDDPRILAQRLLDPVNGFAQHAVAPRFGAVMQREKKGVTKVVAVIYDAVAEIDPLPRRLEAGGQATLHGKLVAGVTKAKVSYCDPAGKLVDLPRGEGSEFGADLRCGDRPGMMMVEVSGDREGQVMSVARFPVRCGVALPTSAQIPPDAKQAEAPGAERRVFDFLNAERAAVQAPALQWDAGVANVAGAASTASRDEARTSSSNVSFDVVAQLKKNDAMSSLVLLNPAASRSPEEAHWRLAHSPLHRSNMLNAEATHSGVGVAVLKDPDLGNIYFLTELLVREQPPVDAPALGVKLRDAVQRRRADARAEKLATDPMLEEVAQKYATALASAKGNVPKAEADAILAPLYKTFRTVSLVGGAKPEPLEFAEEPGVVSPAKVMGVGVAGGSNPVLGRNTAYVIILVGTRR